MTRRLTMAQAIIQFLKSQSVARDGREQTFFGGCLGIFGHGNVAGIGQALQQNPDFPYYLFRNEQAMVHAATGFAKMSNRLRTLVCTSSIGPGATNMVTGAALATINRIPVLLLPGDIFARRNVRRYCSSWNRLPARMSPLMIAFALYPGTGIVSTGRNRFSLRYRRRCAY